MKLVNLIFRQTTATKLLALGVVLLAAVLFMPNGATTEAQNGDIHVLTCDASGNIPLTAVKYFIGAEVKVSLSGGFASVYNGTNCNLPVSLASYEMYDRQLGTQKLFDATGVVIVGSGQSKSLSVSLPACMAQIDLYYGEPLLNLDNANSGSFKTLAWTFHQNGSNDLENATGNFCGNTGKPNLEISKRGPGSVLKNSNVSYEIQVSNVGNREATNVVVTDYIPSGLQYVGATGASCNGNSQTVVCDLGNLPVNNNKYFELEFKVLDTAPCGNLTNKAVVTATNADSREAFSFSNVECQQISLVCTPANQTVALGVNANFSATGGNGSFAWSAQGGNPVSGSGSTFQTKYSTIGNKVVTVTSAGKTATCNVKVEGSTGECKLEIEKSVSKQEVKPGEEFTYTLNFKNSGTKNCTGGGVKVADVLDSKLTFVRASTSNNVTSGYGNMSVYDAGSRTVYFNADTLVPGETGQAKIYVKANSLPACTEIQVPNRGQITAYEYNNFQNWVYSNIVNVKVKTDCVENVVCTPATQTVKINQNANLVATGGNGTYAWTSTGGQPTSGTGSSYQTKYASSGNKTVVVTSAGKTANCKVVVEDYPELVCAPASQNVKLNQTASFVATGGNGTYTWTANGGQPAVGGGNTFSTSYSSTGSKQVKVESAGKIRTCNVVVTEEPQDLVCAPANQNVDINQNTYFVATGGNGTYAWTSTGGQPTSGTGSSYQTKYASSGNKTVVVTSAGKTANCNVTVKQMSLQCSPRLQYADVNQTVNLQASGGNGNFSWYAPEAGIGQATGNSVSVSYSTAGTKNITLYSDGLSDVCQVVVRQGGTNLTIDKKVRNLTRGGGFVDVLNDAAKGDSLQYQIRIRNTGSNPASGIMLKDFLSNSGNLENLRDVTTSMLFTGVFPNNISFNYSLPAGQEIVFSYTYTVASANIASNIQVCNTATAWATNISQISDQVCVYGNSGQPNLVLSKRAWNDTQNVDAETKPAFREDFITYSLTVRNTSNQPATNYVFTDDLSGVLPLADMVDLGGGQLNGNTISYSAVTIPANGTVTKTFKVRVKYNLSGSISYQMLNTFGNTVRIVINPPKPYIPPKTGGLVDLLAGTGFAGLLTAAYAYNRKKNLLKTLAK